MWSRSVTMALAVGLVGLLIGCHHAFGTRVCSVEQWQLDPDTQVRLTSDVSNYPAWADPQLTYREVSMEVCRGREVVHHQVLWRDQRGDAVPTEVPSLDVLRLHAAADRRTAWLVNGSAECLLAQYEVGPKALTIYGQPLPWPKDRESVELPRIRTPDD